MAAIVSGFDHIDDAVVEETERLKEELMEWGPAHGSQRETVEGIKQATLRQY